MSNIDYHVGYLPLSKAQQRSLFIKHWFKKLCKIAFVMLLAFLLYRTFVYNPVPNLQARNSEMVEIIPTDTSSKPTETSQNLEIVEITKTELIEESSDQSINKVEDRVLEPLALEEEMTLPTLNSQRISITMTDLPKKEIQQLSEDPLFEIKQSELVDSVINEVVDIPRHKNQSQNNQLSKILVELEKDNIRKPFKTLNTKITLNQNTTLKVASINKSETTSNPINVDDNKDEFSETAKKPSQDKVIKPASVSLIDIQDIQKSYEQDLNRLTDEVDLENLLKNNYSKYLDN